MLHHVRLGSDDEKAINVRNGRTHRVFLACAGEVVVIMFHVVNCASMYVSQ
jgi:hypothetical protein